MPAAILLKIVGSQQLQTIMRVLLLNATKTILTQVLDVENQRAAVKIMRELRDMKGVPVYRKAAIFNGKMAAWAAMNGKKLLLGTIACLREQLLKQIG